MVVFPFSPCWASRIRETLEWLTEVLQSESGAEQRRSLRLSPRRYLQCEVLQTGVNRAAFDMLVSANGASEWVVPIWTDFQPLAAPILPTATVIPCQTVGYDFVPGAYVVMRHKAWDSAVAYEITAVTSGGVEVAGSMGTNWPAGALVYPAHIGTLRELPQVTRTTPGIVRAPVSFELTTTADWAPWVPTALYRGYPVLDLPTHVTAEPTSGYERITTRLDNSTGVYRITDTAGMSFPVTQMAWMAKHRADKTKIRSLLYLLNGRQKAIWVPTRTPDLRVTGISGNTLTYSPMGFDGVPLGKAGRDHLAMFTNSGETLYRRITARTASSITLDAAVGVALAEIRMVSFMALMRQSDDRADIEYLTQMGTISTCAVSFRGVKESLEL